jgi:putative FmdB family regulatory protein
MPIYAYRCSACGHQEDKLQKMSDAPLTVCPACGQSTYSKQVTAAGFQLKGSGWYVTDFRNNGAAPTTSTTAGAGKSGGEAAAKSAPAGAAEAGSAGASAGVSAGASTAASTSASSPTSAPASTGTPAAAS